MIIREATLIRVTDAVAERLPRPYEAPPRGSRCGCRVGDSPRNYSITLPPSHIPSIDTSLQFCTHTPLPQHRN